MHKGFALRFGTVLALSILMSARPSAAAKPEDVFKGKIIITKNRLPMHFSSPGGFVSALQKNKIDKIWPTEEKGDDKGTWDLEYLAFFAQPLDDSEIQVKFYDITHGDKKYVAGEHPAGQAGVRRAQALHDDHRIQGARHRDDQLLASGQGRQLHRQGRVLRRRHARQVTRDDTRGDRRAGAE
jgi:hypothetical protein